MEEIIWDIVSSEIIISSHIVISNISNIISNIYLCALQIYIVNMHYIFSGKQ